MTTTLQDQLISATSGGSFSFSHALGSGEGGFYLKEPKTQSSARTIPLTQRTFQTLRAMRDDFNALPPQAQALMLELLAGADPGNMDFWKEMLGLKMPDAPPISA